MSNIDLELKRWIGTPYVLGGSSPHIGLDCVGLVIAACKLKGIDIERTEYSRIGRLDVIKQHLNTIGTRLNEDIFMDGDILLFRPGHLGIWCDNGIIHSMNVPGVIYSQWNTDLVNKLIGAWRID